MAMSYLYVGCHDFATVSITTAKELEKFVVFLNNLFVSLNPSKQNNEKRIVVNAKREKNHVPIFKKKR